MSLTQSSFGSTSQGVPVVLFELKNKQGMCCRLINYGLAIQSLIVPDRKGRLVDVVLGYDTVERYENRANPSHGAVVGRHANRIQGARFELNGRIYTLTANDGPNNLHSYPVSFDRVIWDYTVINSGDEPAIEFSYLSPDGESGYPGNLNCKVIYRLTESNVLQITYEASADQDTVINLTNHVYFNLKGHQQGSILDHDLTIDADYFTPIDRAVIPDGQILSVENTPFDFRQATQIGKSIIQPSEQIDFGLGYDHNFVLNGYCQSNSMADSSEQVLQLHPCATLHAEETGITLSVTTTSPGVQFYSGNYLDEQHCKSGANYAKYSGLCLETQFYPNSLHHKHFPSPIFKAGEVFHHRTDFNFSV